MRPGDPARTGTVDIKNTGSLSGAFTLKPRHRRRQRRTYKLSTKLDLVVKDCGDFSQRTPDVRRRRHRQVHRHGRGPELPTSSLGTFAGGEKHRYQFSVTVNTSRRQQLPGQELGRPVLLERRLARRASIMARRIARVVSTLVVAAGLLFGALLILPAALGWQRYVITSGSMTGTYDRGSLVLDEVVPVADAARGRRHHLPPAGRRRPRRPRHAPDRGDHAPTARSARVPHQGRRQRGRRPVDVHAGQGRAGARARRRPLCGVRARSARAPRPADADRRPPGRA